MEKDASDELITQKLIESMQKWGKRYPYVGYGSSFYNWVFDDERKAYGSYGNGSAMRVSSIGWFYDSLDRTRQVARLSALVSHNHKEGIKGAECVTSVIYLGRSGYSKAYIEDYVIRNFGYDFSEGLRAMQKKAQA